MAKTITVTPNFNAIFKRYLDFAISQIKVSATQETWSQGDVYTTLHGLSVALLSTTSTEELQTMRDQLTEALKPMFADMTKRKDNV